MKIIQVLFVWMFSHGEGVTQCSDGKLTSQIRFHCSSLLFAAPQRAAHGAWLIHIIKNVNFGIIMLCLHDCRYENFYLNKNKQENYHQPDILPWTLKNVNINYIFVFITHFFTHNLLLDLMKINWLYYTASLKFGHEIWKYLIIQIISDDIRPIPNLIM